MKQCRMQWMAVMSCISLAAAAAHAAPRYQVIDLGQGYTPVSFNDNGQVVLQNTSSLSEGSFDQLYLWENGKTTLLFSCDGFYDIIYNVSMNNSGIITSNVSANYGSISYSMVINKNQIETQSSAFFFDINDSGQMVQWSQHPVTGETQTHMRELEGTLFDCGNDENAFTVGTAINTWGWITGGTGNDRKDFNAFVWDVVSGKHCLSRLEQDIGSCGFDINASGLIVGYSATNMGSLYFPENRDWNLVYWDTDGQIVNLGCKLNPVGDSLSLNDLDQIVGSFKMSGDTGFLPYFWQEDIGFIAAQDLLDDDSPWTLTQLTQINNQGQIIASARIDGQLHGVLLLPVPEPAAFSLLLSGILLFRKKLKR